MMMTVMAMVMMRNLGLYPEQEIREVNEDDDDGDDEDNGDADDDDNGGGGNLAALNKCFAVQEQLSVCRNHLVLIMGTMNNPCQCFHHHHHHQSCCNHHLLLILLPTQEAEHPPHLEDQEHDKQKTEHILNIFFSLQDLFTKSV